ncbi:MAG TPA: DinB family protein [Gemmatimonadales bacterium]
MTGVTIPRPEQEEAAPFYHGYIDRVTGEDIGRQLTEQLNRVELLFRGMDDATGRFRYAPGKWSIKEVLGHLTDAERIFAYRLLRIARSDTTPLPGFDEKAYVPPASFDSRSVRSLVEEFRALRLSTMALVENLPAEAWDRRGQASGRTISARALAYIMVGHVSHHLGVLEERYGAHVALDL